MDQLFPHITLFQRKVFFELIVIPAFVWIINLNDSNLLEEGGIWWKMRYVIIIMIYKAHIIWNINIKRNYV